MRKYQYVIQVDIDELICHISQHIVDECLKNCGDVRKTKRKNTIIKVPPGVIKSSFPFIPLSYANQMISVAEVQFRDKLSSRVIILKHRTSHRRTCTQQTGSMTIFAPSENSIFAPVYMRIMEHEPGVSQYYRSSGSCRSEESQYSLSVVQR